MNLYENIKNNIKESEDDIITCEWCGNKVDASECKKELNLGWICKDCQDTLYSRGEHATYDEYANYYDDITSMNESSYEDYYAKPIWFNNKKLYNEYKSIIEKQLRDGALDDPTYIETLSDEKFEALVTGTWLLDKENKEIFEDNCIKPYIDEYPEYAKYFDKNGVSIKESEDNTRIMEIIPDSGANSDYVNVIIYQGNKLIFDKVFYYGYDISNSEESERDAHNDYERSIKYNWNEPYYYKEKPYTPKLIKKLMDEYNISSNNVILRPAENTSWHPRNYSSNSHIENTKEMLKDLNINQEIEPSFHDSIIVKENPDKSIYIKDLHGDEFTFENVKDAINDFEKKTIIDDMNSKDRTKIADGMMNGYILSNLWDIKKARGAD